jgi:hypothetical protein
MNLKVVTWFHRLTYDHSRQKLLFFFYVLSPTIDRFFMKKKIIFFFNKIMSWPIPYITLHIILIQVFNLNKLFLTKINKIFLEMVYSFEMYF